MLVTVDTLVNVVPRATGFGDPLALLEYVAWPACVGAAVAPTVVVFGRGRWGTSVAVGVGVDVAPVVGVLVAVLVGVGAATFDMPKASRIDPDGTNTCPAPDDGATKCTGVPARLCENSCWPVLGLKPSSRRLPVSRFQTTPPAMIGGLEPGSPPYPLRTVVTVKLAVPVVLTWTAFKADVHRINTVLGAKYAPKASASWPESQIWPRTTGHPRGRDWPSSADTPCRSCHSGGSSRSGAGWARSSRCPCRWRSGSTIRER